MRRARRGSWSISVYESRGRYVLLDEECPPPFAASRLITFDPVTHHIPLLHNAAILLEPDSVQRPLDL
jgi:hypothetical protein